MNSIARIILHPIKTRKHIQDLSKQVEVQQKSLEIITRDFGRVCENFELCNHRSCDSAYGAWQIASFALNREDEAVNKLHEDPNALF